MIGLGDWQTTDFSQERGLLHPPRSILERLGDMRGLDVLGAGPRARFLPEFAATVNRFRTGEASGLPGPGGFHARPNCGRGFAAPVVRQLLEGDARDKDVDIDAIEERPGYAYLVLAYQAGAAAACVLWVAEVTTRTSV